MGATIELLLLLYAFPITCLAHLLQQPQELQMSVIMSKGLLACQHTSVVGIDLYTA